MSQDEMTDQPAPKRGRKRAATRRRIAEASLRLYEVNGYDGTTLTAISDAAGISPRTLFLHFATKEDTLKYWREEGFLDRLRPVMEALPACKSPLASAQEGISRLVAEQDPDHSARIDRLLESNEALWAHKQAIFVQFEDLLRIALGELWPGEKADDLRTVAMLATGAMRLAMSRWREDGAVRPINGYLEEEFGRLGSILPNPAG